jgi:hypothetical protein
MAVLPEWVRLLTSIIFSWQFLIYLVLIYLLFCGGAAQKIEDLLAPFQSLTLFGTKLELNQQSGRNVETAVAMYRRRVQRKFDRWDKKESHYCPAKLSGSRPNSLKIRPIAYGRSRNDLNWKGAGLTSFREFVAPRRDGLEAI